MKTRRIAYWMATALTAFVFLSGGAADLAQPGFVMEGMTHLGYPAYFVTILGVWKILGGLAVLVPRFPRLKEWAYAGMLFDLTGAAASHAAVGDPVGKIVTPLILLGIVATSWALRPQGRTPSWQDHALRPIGRIRSTLRALDEAPRQGSEGAPDAWLEVDPAFTRALRGVATGDEVIVMTWLHRADRDVLEVHPRGDPENPLAGVFATRSPHRPNPVGLHRVTVREIAGTRLRIGPIEAIEGTPVVDLKPVLAESADA